MTNASIGPVSVLVNSAGVLQRTLPPEQLGLAEWDFVVRVDLRGTYVCCAAFGARMAARGAGAIVNIASVAGMRSGPLHSYGPAKAGVIHLSECLAAEWGPKGVRVNTVSPGFTQTPALDKGKASGTLEDATMSASTALGRLIRPEEMPYRTGLLYRDGTPVSYDPADFPAAFDRLLRAFDYEGWRQRQAEARGGHRPIGIGLAAYVQGTGVGPFEGADVRIDGGGAVHVFIGVSSQGQAHETTMAQIAATELGVDPERVFVVAADTSALPFGNGTGGSRVAANAGPAVARSAREVAVKARRVAAELLECAPEDVVLAGGRAQVAGVPQRGMPLGDLSRAALKSKTLAREGSPGLQACGYFAPESVTFAFGAQACAAEVDVETGAVRLLRYLAAHDCGRAINPMVVEGQLHGGIAQGIGTALYEEQQYDANGQPNASTLADYLIPGPTEIPAIRIFHLESPSPYTELGIKGMGEGGAIAPPAVVFNAVNDALQHLGVEVTETPLTPRRLLAAIAAAARKRGNAA